MEKLQLFLLVLQIVIAVVMIILVLIQKTDGDSLGGIGGGSGGMGAVISGKATANALSKFTMILAAVFMINCLILATISGGNKGIEASEFQEIIKEKEEQPAGPRSLSAPAID